MKITSLLSLVLLFSEPAIQPTQGSLARGTDEHARIDAAAEGQTADEVEGSRPADRLVDVELESWRIGLLERAFEVASRLPHAGHPKDRARTQAIVLEAMLELGQPNRVLELAGRIENWRRAEMLAAVALHAARVGCDEGLVRELIARSDRNHPADIERWRHDRIDLKIAQALAEIGDLDGAVALETDFEPASQGRIVAGQVGGMDRADVDRLLEQLDRVLETRDFDLALNSIDIMIRMHDRFYADVALRSDLERRVDEAAVLAKIPHDRRILSTLALADTAIGRGDEAHGRLLTGRARGIFEAIESRNPFPVEFGVPVIGELARRRAESGDIDGAVAQIEDARARYEADPRRIADVFRAGAFRPVLEAAIATGRDEVIDPLMLFVLEVGSTNPNGRPRVQDLARTLATISLAGRAPSPEAMASIDSIEAGLASPW